MYNLHISNKKSKSNRGSIHSQEITFGYPLTSEVSRDIHCFIFTVPKMTTNNYEFIATTLAGINSEHGIIHFFLYYYRLRAKYHSSDFYQDRLLLDYFSEINYTQETFNLSTG